MIQDSTSSSPQPGIKQTTLDRDISDWLHGYQASGRQIHCRKGCRGCCDLVVNTTFPEAAAIAAALTPQLQQALADYIDRLRRQLPAAKDFKSFLRIHRKDVGFCPFLDIHGTCAIYALRPLSCRALLSTRPAEWCAVDFSSLHEHERAAFVSSLDRDVVAFPSHYVAATQQAARSYERELLNEMLSSCGLALAGHLPTLVWLEQEFQLSRNIHRGGSWITRQAKNAGLAADYLLDLQFDNPGGC